MARINLTRAYRAPAVPGQLFAGDQGADFEAERAGMKTSVEMSSVRPSNAAVLVCARSGAGPFNPSDASAATLSAPVPPCLPAGPAHLAYLSRRLTARRLALLRAPFALVLARPPRAPCQDWHSTARHLRCDPVERGAPSSSSERRLQRRHRSGGNAQGVNLLDSPSLNGHCLLHRGTMPQ